MRHLVRQVFDKDGTLLAEHDWLHDDPTYANFFLRSAAERGEWLPVRLRDQAGPQPDYVPVSAGADQPEAVFAGVDVQRDRISVSTASHQASPGISLVFGAVDVQRGRIDRVELHQHSIQVGTCDRGVALSYVETGRESVVFLLSDDQVALHIASLIKARYQAFGGVKAAAGQGA